MNWGDGKAPSRYSVGTSSQDAFRLTCEVSERLTGHTGSSEIANSLPVTSC